MFVGTHVFEKKMTSSFASRGRTGVTELSVSRTASLNLQTSLRPLTLGLSTLAAEVRRRIMLSAEPTKVPGLTPSPRKDLKRRCRLAPPHTGVVCNLGRLFALFKPEEPRWRLSACLFNSLSPWILALRSLRVQADELQIYHTQPSCLIGVHCAYPGGARP